MQQADFAYQDGDVTCIGNLTYDPKHGDSQPGVILFPAFEGRKDLFLEQAETLASEGFAVLVADVYGEGKVGTSIEESMSLLMPFFENRVALRARVQAAFDAIQQVECIDTQRISAIGFCFGGMCALDLARSGAAIQGAVGFHSVFAAPDGLANETITAKILLLHGYDDPQVPPEALADFAKEMDAANVDWQCLFYGNVMHAFTDREAVEVDMGRKYDPVAHQRSWQQMVRFLRSL